MYCCCCAVQHWREGGDCYVYRCEYAHGEVRLFLFLLFLFLHLVAWRRLNRHIQPARPLWEGLRAEHHGAWAPFSLGGLIAASGPPFSLGGLLEPQSYWEGAASSTLPPAAPLLHPCLVK